jgi:DNA-binding response OmpR family regulator
MDGATLISGLRNHALFGNCKLVVLTALDAQQREPYAAALDGVDVVHKPRLVQELPPLIEAALGHLLADKNAAEEPAPAANGGALAPASGEAAAKAKASKTKSTKPKAKAAGKPSQPSAG